eukprot:958786-Pleurochrysis_carterae.AAC.1
MLRAVERERAQSATRACACVCMCVRACVRASACVRVRVCMCMCVCVRYVVLARLCALTFTCACACACLLPALPSSHPLNLRIVFCRAQDYGVGTECGSLGMPEMGAARWAGGRHATHTPVFRLRSRPRSSLAPSLAPSLALSLALARSSSLSHLLSTFAFPSFFFSLFPTSIYRFLSVRVKRTAHTPVPCSALKSCFFQSGHGCFR